MGRNNVEGVLFILRCKKANAVPGIKQGTTILNMKVRNTRTEILKITIITSYLRLKLLNVTIIIIGIEFKDSPEANSAYQGASPQS